jgi:excisionase family DNA binding protein
MTIDNDFDNDYLTVDQAARVAGVRRRSIYNWIAAGRVPVVRTAGGQIRIARHTLFPGPPPVGPTDAWRDALPRLALRLAVLETIVDDCRALWPHHQPLPPAPIDDARSLVAAISHTVGLPRGEESDQ